MEQVHVPKDEAQPVMVQERKPTEYTHVPLMPRLWRFRSSTREAEHLALATMLVVGVGLSLDFASNTNLDYLLLAVSTTAFTFSFLLHEMAHKVVAQKYGLWAEFRLITMGAILTAVSIVLPLKFISPGAVIMSGAADQRTMGKTAIAGPATNIVLATVFSSIIAGFPNYASGLGVVAWFNAWIAVINLIPFGIFDGTKVFVWNKAVWALTFGMSAALTAVLTIMFLA